MRRALALALVAALSASCGRIGYDLLPLTGDAAIGIDAAVDTPADAFVCPAICSAGCAGGVCNIAGDQLDATQTAIQCPAGMPCHVTCMARQSCKTRIVCADGPCTVDCVGDRSCFFGATCGTGACTIRCPGADACGPLDCAQASACAVDCSGSPSCRFGLTCCGDGACDVACTGTGSCPSSTPIRCDTDPDCNQACP